MTPPEVILFGGCNGAGKTTLALQLLTKGLHLYEFVNADNIAQGLNPLNPLSQAGLASRLAIQRVNDLVAQGRSFAFEGTLAGSWQARILKRCRDQGYATRMFFVWLPSVAMAQQRVKNRVAQGGHDVPPTDIERRYNAGLRHLNRLYLPLVETAVILDGGVHETQSHQRIIAQKQADDFIIHQPEKWNLICQTP